MFSFKTRMLFDSFSLFTVLMLSGQAVLADSVDNATDRQSSTNPLSPVITGYISDEEISEVSGLAISDKNPGILWVINDSGNLPFLYAINEEGELLYRVEVKGAENRDWEDLALFSHEGKDYLLIADIGDNYSVRSQYQIYVVKEPDLSEAEHNTSVKLGWSITYTYPDGARDAESVAVDVKNQSILILSKRDRPPVLYQLPLKPASNVIARKAGNIGEFAARESGLFAIFNYNGQPTAMDITRDGKLVGLLTYDSSYLYHSKADSEWQVTLSSEPTVLDRPELNQAESMAFSPDGKYLYITSEKIPAPVLKIKVQD